MRTVARDFARQIGRPHRTRFALVLSAAFAGALALAGCGGDSTRVSGSEPAQSGAFVDGAFAGVPKPGGAVPFEPALHTDGVWVQSFEVHSLGAADVLQFYASALGEGWAQLSPPSAGAQCSTSGGTGADGCAFRAVWIKDSQKLEVAVFSDGMDASGHGGTELSLMMTDGG